MRYSYYWRQFLSELAFSVRNPRRKNWFELRYVWTSLVSATTYPIRVPFYFLRKVWAYRDILWDDSDWDHSFLLAMMERKLRRMADYHQHRGHLVDHKRQAQQMRVAAQLCKRIRAEEYDAIPLARLAEKYGELDMTFEPTDNQHLSKICISRPGLHTERDREYEAKATRRIYKHAEAQRKADIAYLGRLFNRHLLCWWD